MVNVFLIDYDFGIAAFYELLHEFFKGTVVYIHCIYLRPGHHTVANLGVGEVKGILEYLHFLIDFILISGIVDAGLDEIVQIHLRETFIIAFRIHLYSNDTEKAACEERGETAYRPKHDIEQVSGKRKEGQQSVGVVLEENLGQKLARKKHDDGGKDGICRHFHTSIERPEEAHRYHHG